MRLGAAFFKTDTIEGLEPLCEKLDCYGLSAIQAPGNLADLSEEAAQAFGRRARELGLVIGESGMWENLMAADPKVRAGRVEQVRRRLVRARVMGCGAVVVLAGSRAEHALAPHPGNYGQDYRTELREILLGIVDGLELGATRLVIEPWHNTFFYQPEDIRDFLDSVGDPRIGLHLDQMNMVSHATFYDTAGLIRRTFDLLADRVGTVHVKDVACDHRHMFLKYDEVAIGDGVMDYGAYLRALATLDPDMPCYLEHMAEERDYVLSIARLHWLAEKEGLRFRRRGEAAGPGA